MRIRESAGIFGAYEITDKFDSLLYTIESKPEDMVYSINSDYFKMTLKPATTSYPEYKFSVKITAITGLIQSNTIKFNYERTYVHPWEYATYTVAKEAKELVTYDGIYNNLRQDENIEDYYWVQYEFSVKDGFYNPPGYPYIMAKTVRIVDDFSSDCIVIQGLNRLTPNIQNSYYLESSERILNTREISYKLSVIVGYPKTIYNENANNLNITNTANLYINYQNSEEFTYADTADVSINLNDFTFDYDGNLYSISKNLKSGTRTYNNFISGKLYFESLIGEDTKIV